MKISYIIPNCTSDKMLTNMIDSFLNTNASSQINKEFIIVNNGSPKKTTDFIENYLQKNKKLFENYKIDVQLHEVPYNMGYPAAVNFGFKNASGDILVALNSDIIFTKAIELDILKSFEIDPEIAIVGGKYLYPDGKIQHGGIIRVPQTQVFIHSDWHKKYIETYESNIAKYMIAVTGAFFCIKKSYIEKHGMLDEKYWLAYDDTAYCMQAWENGHKIYYNPAIELIHLEGATRGNSDEIKKKISKVWTEKEMESKDRFEKLFPINRIIKVENKVCKANNKNKTKILEALNEKHGKLGIRRLGARGDVLLLTGVIKEISLRYPNIVINVLTRCKDVFLNNPYVNVATNIKEYFDYDVLIDLDLEYERYPNQHIIASYLNKIFGDKLKKLPKPEIYTKKYDIEKVEFILPNFKNRRYIIIHPAKTWECREIPHDRWIQIANQIYNSFSKNYEIIIIGTYSDYNIKINNKIIDLRGYTNIQNVKILIDHAQLFLGIDSLMTHVAQTTDTKAISVYTSVNPEYRNIDKDFIIPDKDTCRFCLHLQNPPVTSCECSQNESAYLECVKNITWKKIINKMKEVLK